MLQPVLTSFANQKDSKTCYFKIGSLELVKFNENLCQFKWHTKKEQGVLVYVLYMHVGVQMSGVQIKVFQIVSR